MVGSDKYEKAVCHPRQPFAELSVTGTLKLLEEAAKGRASPVAHEAG